jgi:hypothetical protein
VRSLLPGLLVLSTLTLPAPLFAQESGRLQAVREEVRGDKDRSDDHPKKGNKSDGRRDDDCDDGFMGQLFLMLALSPWILPHMALNDNFKTTAFSAAILTTSTAKV